MSADHAIKEKSHLTSEKEYLDLNIFTEKEILILDMLLQGLTSKEIAHYLGYSETWVYHPINRIFLKAQCKTRTIEELKAKFK